jgi:SAM-dependent methyltransferase
MHPAPIPPPSQQAPPKPRNPSEAPTSRDPWSTRKRDVPYVPTDDQVVRGMLKFANVSPSDLLYDLGCGDGRIVIAAAKHCGASGIGVDIDPLRIQECHDNLRRAHVGDRVKFLQASLFDLDLSPASVVVLYLLPSLNIRLRPKILSELRPGSRVISNHFDMANWRPDETLHAHHRKLYKWIVPAPIVGEWHCTINDPAGRRRIILNLHQQYQIVTGTAHVAGRPALIGEGRITGDTLTFRLVEWGRDGAIMRYRAQIEGPQLRGTTWREGHEEDPVPWGGTRT